MLQIINSVDSHHAHFFHVLDVKGKLDKVRASLNNIISHALFHGWSPEIEDEFINLSKEEETLAHKLITV